jgi:hypothetical protein
LVEESTEAGCGLRAVRWRSSWAAVPAASVNLDVAYFVAKTVTLADDTVVTLAQPTSFSPSSRRRSSSGGG